MVLVSVLGVLGILYIMMVQLSADVTFTAQYYQRVAFKERAYYMSRSAYAGVIRLLAMEDSKFDSLHDQWAQELPPYEFPDEQVFLRIKVEDQERYFNPNTIIGDGGKEDKKHLEQFKRLLEVLQQDPALANAFLDWMDPDEQARLPGGADGLDYKDIPAKGGTLDSLEEIRLIKGVNDDVYRGSVSMGMASPGLKNVLSVFTNGKVNLNTAGREVLLSLDDEMSEDLVAEIIRRREEKPFEKMEELLELPGMNHDLNYRIKQLADVKSEHFKITITVENYQKETEDLTVIVKRSGQAGKVVFWQAY